MWPRHVISLVITFNNIPLSPLIALTYRLVSDGSSFWYTKPYSSIIGNRLFTLHYWEAHQPLSHFLRSPPAAILFFLKAFPPSSTAVLIFTHQHPICWDTTFLDSILLEFWSPLIALQLQADDAFINPFPARLVVYGVARKCPWSTQSSKPMEPSCGWWEYNLLDTTSMAP